MDSDTQHSDSLPQNIEKRYEEATAFLFAQLPMFSRIGAAAYKPGLDTSLRLDEYFGHPHRSYRTVHIAGTNGKGSCSHMLAAILQSAGYRTGLYTSPHLADFRERMRVDGKMISKEEVVDFTERWRGCGYDGHPSFFELTMMMAFDWFARKSVDVAVIEVGMGGRLDSTNIITPEACVITNISPDHMQFLGDTLPKIASEKAGIIKRGIPVVIGEAEGEVREVFARKAAEVGAPIVFAQDTPLLDRCEETEDPMIGGRDCRAAIAGGDFHAALGGDYQCMNIETTLHAVEALRRQGFEIPAEAVAKGMAEVVKMTGLMGRWMRTSHNPETVCDTGHNIAGLSQTMPQLERLRRRCGGMARLVLGFVSDKDVAHIVHLLPRDGIYYATQASVPRAMDARQLYEYLKGEGLQVTLCEEGVAKAAEKARSEASPEDVIYIGGSTFVVADMLRAAQLPITNY